MSPYPQRVDVERVAATTLRRAADHMDAVGLNQDGAYFSKEHRALPEEQRPCCIIGALNTAMEEVKEWPLSVYAAAWDAVRMEVMHRSEDTSMSITHWNDSVATSMAAAQGLQEAAA